MASLQEWLASRTEKGSSGIMLRTPSRILGFIQEMHTSQHNELRNIRAVQAEDVVAYLEVLKPQQMQQTRPFPNLGL